MICFQADALCHAVGTRSWGRDLTAARGRAQPFQHKMLATCEDPTSFLSCPLVRTVMRGISQVCRIHQARSSPFVPPPPCCWPFHVIKHPVITHLLAVCCVVSLCYTNKAGVAHSKVVRNRGGCQHKRCIIQRFWSSRGSNVRRPAPTREDGGFREVQVAVFHNTKRHSS